MIVPMKKVSIITQSKDADSAVKALRSLGLLHVEHQQTPKGKDISSLHEDITLANTAINILKTQSPSQETSTAVVQEALTNWEFTARHIIDLQKRLEQLDEYSRNLSLKINQWELWGDFDPQAIKVLEDKNVYIWLYQIPVKEIKNLPPGIIVKRLSTASGIANCVIISYGKTNIPFKEVALPKIGLEKMRDRLSEDLQVMNSMSEEIRKSARYREAFIRVKKDLEKELEFHEALRGMGQSGDLSYLTGYAPFDKVELVSAEAKTERWGIVISEPSADDNVPVLLRNPRWVSIISPIFKFLEILPGYRELDISLPFLIFFGIFFGMLIGDAGYGLVYFLFTLWAHKEAKRKNRQTGRFFLFYVLSLCAIIWGLLTGTFFGQEWFLKAGYRPLAPVLNDPKGIQRFCFFLGALHLSIAHSWRAVLKIPSLGALADVGWICILWSAFFIARALILGDTFPLFGKWMIISGIFLVILFTNLQKNILKTISEGLGTLALSLMNNFTDVVSYIRLFAVGLAGVKIADAFNAMAAMVGWGNVFAAALAALIAIIGNTLGLILGPVSVLVHGVRLNVLEFSGHANISWSGGVYKPLKE